ncbi:hypothetical protein AB0B45_02325 [Nonomuraea sp. NPDC049152]|uniref:hypothetical protein n=1 Tax=Nonomuraea sp. NPDC049152 TaxID=3154350 RepID=UPI0033D156E4
MLLFSPSSDDMELPIGDDPAGGPDLTKVDQAAKLFYQHGHARRGAFFVGGQMQYLSDRTWFVCVRDTPAGQPPQWVLYAIVDHPTGLPGQYRTEPVSAAEFASALAGEGRTVAIRKYDNWEITYSLDGESVLP